MESIAIIEKILIDLSPLSIFIKQPYMGNIKSGLKLHEDFLILVDGKLGYVLKHFVDRVVCLHSSECLEVKNRRLLLHWLSPQPIHAHHVDE